MAATVIDSFYVYEFWRPDTGNPFYVGKGHGNRAWDLRKRKGHCGNVIKKITAAGASVQIEIVARGMMEIEALNFEVERIKFWRSAGVALTNVTDGGEGVSGLKHSEASKSVIREKRKNQVIKHSTETRAKIGQANRVALIGRKNPEHSARLKGRPLSDEHKKKISAAGIGRFVSQSSREKASASNLGKKRSAETISRLATAHLGNKHSEETRAKMSTSQKARWAAR